MKRVACLMVCLMLSQSAATAETSEKPIDPEYKRCVLAAQSSQEILKCGQDLQVEGPKDETRREPETADKRNYDLGQCTIEARTAYPDPPTSPALYDPQTPQPIVAPAASASSSSSSESGGGAVSNSFLKMEQSRKERALADLYREQAEAQELATKLQRAQAELALQNVQKTQAAEASRQSYVQSCMRIKGWN